MSNYLHRFYPWQALKLAIKSLKTPPKTISQQQQPLLKKYQTPDSSSVKTLFQYLHKNPSTFYRDIGFKVYKKPSTIPKAGMGVYLEGECQAGQIVCLYPGTVYLPYEPLLFVSISNKYILKCFDGTFIDGKINGLSGRVYSSIYHRENYFGSLEISDITWMTDQLRNPLAIGQIVNNGTKKYPANVYYQEIDLPFDFPPDLRQYIPNTYWSPIDPLSNDTRIVALIASRDIKNEELFSTYMDSF